jgi:hypothetical protein
LRTRRIPSDKASGAPPPHAEAAAAHVPVAARASLTSAQERAAHTDQRQRQLAEDRRRGRRPRYREIEGFAHSIAPAGVLGSLRDDVDGLQTEEPGDMDEESALAPVGVEQRHLQVRSENRDDDPRHTAPRSDIDHAGPGARDGSLEQPFGLCHVA